MVKFLASLQLLFIYNDLLVAMSADAPSPGCLWSSALISVKVVLVTAGSCSSPSQLHEAY